MTSNFNKFFKRIIYESNASLLDDIPSKDLGLFNSMTRLPMSKPYGFWMNKHGNFVPVSGGIGAHERMAKIMLSKAEKMGYDIDLSEIDSVYDFLLNAGWVRILTTSKLYYETEPGRFPTNIQKKNMRFIAEFYELKGVEMG